MCLLGDEASHKKRQRSWSQAGGGGVLGRRLEQLLKRYERGEVARVEWLDHLTLARIHQLRVQVAAQCPLTLSHPLCVSVTP